MNGEKVFCESCRKDVEYRVENMNLKGTIKGDGYTYLGKIAYCTECNSEIYVGEINDFNLKALYDQFREKHGIIPLETILKIPNKYKIGKRPLSLLLGWGEQTFSRYCDGDIPTKQYSDILMRIYEDPEYYRQILEENKGNLKTELTYKKSKKAVEALCTSNSVTQNDKMDLVIEYLLYQCEDITPLALQKALYYVQGFYCAFYNTFLFTEDCEAWVHGPVYRDIYFRYRDYKFNPVMHSNKFQDLNFLSSEKAILDSVVNHVCCYSGKVLEKFTHSETPWVSARGHLSENEKSDKIIHKDDIKIYFQSVKEKYNMINPNDIKSYTQAMFQQI